MARRQASPAARLRGMAAGLVTAILALAAHGLANGAAPSGAGAALLCVLAATVGAVAATTDRTSDAWVLLGLLASGQLVAHLILALGSHHWPVAGPVCRVCPWPAMLAAHTVALVVAAVLIAAGDRLCRAVCTAIRAAVRQITCPVIATAAVPTVGGDQPLQSALLLAASVSHRGPPVGLTR